MIALCWRQPETGAIRVEPNQFAVGLKPSLIEKQPDLLLFDWTNGQVASNKRRESEIRESMPIDAELQLFAWPPRRPQSAWLDATSYDYISGCIHDWPA